MILNVLYRALFREEDSGVQSVLLACSQINISTLLSKLSYAWIAALGLRLVYDICVIIIGFCVRAWRDRVRKRELQLKEGIPFLLLSYGCSLNKNEMITVNVISRRIRWTSYYFCSRIPYRYQSMFIRIEHTNLLRCPSETQRPKTQQL